MSLREILTNYDHFFFDLDGVIWELEKLLPNVSVFLNDINNLSKSIYYVSNNTNHSRATFHSLFTNLGLPSTMANILSASYNCAMYLQTILEPGSKVMVIGSRNLADELTTSGFQVISSMDMVDVKMTTTELGRLEVDPEVKAVVVGYTLHLNFYIMSYAINCIHNGAVLITSNYDAYDKAGKYLIPGAGCTIEFLKYATKCELINVGKPEQWAIDKVIERESLDRKKCVIFGDKMMTDILVGVRAGISTVLVLTGADTRESYQKHEFKPDFVFENLEYE